MAAQVTMFNVSVRFHGFRDGSGLCVCARGCVCLMTTQISQVAMLNVAVRYHCFRNGAGLRLCSGV